MPEKNINFPQNDLENRVKIDTNINRRHCMRDLELRLNVLNGESTASCKITAGKIITVPNGIKLSFGDHTSVLCSMLGPYEERRKRIKPTFAIYPNRLRLSIFIRPNCGTITNRYRSYEFIINKLLQGIITTNSLPQCGLSFIVQIFNDAGSLLAHSINSCVIACIVGGIPIEYIPIAVSIGIAKPNLSTKNGNNSLNASLNASNEKDLTKGASNENAEMDSEIQFILDPSTDDLARCTSSMTVVCDPSKDVIISINVDNGLCMLDKSSYKILIELALKSAKLIREEISRSCNAHWNHINKVLLDNNTIDEDMN